MDNASRLGCIRPLIGLRESLDTNVCTDNPLGLGIVVLLDAIKLRLFELN